MKEKQDMLLLLRIRKIWQKIKSESSNVNEIIRAISNRLLLLNSLFIYFFFFFFTERFHMHKKHKRHKKHKKHKDAQAKAQKSK